MEALGSRIVEIHSEAQLIISFDTISTHDLYFPVILLFFRTVSLARTRSCGAAGTTSTAAATSAAAEAESAPSVTVPLWGGRLLLSTSLELTSSDNRRCSNASNGLRCKRNVYTGVLNSVVG